MIKRKQIMLLVSGDHNGDHFCTANTFAFDPPICVRPAPKMEHIFQNKGIEKCIRICEQMEWEYKKVDCLMTITEPKYKSRSSG